MMNIKHCCSESESVCRENHFNKQVADFLSGIINKKAKKQCDNVIPDARLPGYQYDDKYYHGNTLFFTPEIKNSDCHYPEKHDITLIYSAQDKRKDIIFKNDITQYIVCKNITAEPSDTTPDNAMPAEEPENRPAEEPENRPAETEYHPGEDRCETNIIPEAVIAAELPEPSVFHHYPLSDISPERKNLPLRHYEPEKTIQEKISQMAYHSGKHQLSPESGRPDYYCSYHFRQKHQLPEPVHIYREKPGRFKLETSSESLKRRLKSAVNINGMDNVDI